MSCRVSICSIIRFLPCFLVAVLSVSAQFTGAAEKTGDEKRPGLALFVSAPDQVLAEKELRDLKAGHNRFDGSTMTADGVPDANAELPGSAIDSVTPEPAEDNLSGGNYSVPPRRFDGVVLKGEQILGVWFDGSRYRDASGNPASVGINYVDRTGRIRVSAGGESVELSPGDTLAPSSTGISLEINGASPDTSDGVNSR